VAVAGPPPRRADRSDVVDWLTFAVGAITGALGIAVPVLIAWRQRVAQIRDRAADREQDRRRELENQEREAKIGRREQWQPEYDAIRKHLECGETLAYHVLFHGPFTMAEFEALDVATLRMNAEILADRGVDRMSEPLLALADLVDMLVQNAVPEEVALVTQHGQNGPPDYATAKISLRHAVIQGRASRDLAELIKDARRILRTEWGE
jgi:hypothetical protein